MYTCLKCGVELGDLVGWDTLCDEYIECPKCENKMNVHWDESYDSSTGEEEGWFFIEQH